MQYRRAVSGSNLIRAARGVASVPIILAGVLWDEYRWEKLRHRPDYEPGMREWFAATWEDVRRQLP